MRKLGIDYGTKKVGLALTDEAGQMAFPHSVVPNDTTLLDTVVALVADQAVDTVVIGQSLNNQGEPNSVQAAIEAFIADLTLRTPVPIHQQPEQYTSAAAAATTGKNSQTDAAAAALILDSYLQQTASTVPAAPEPYAPEITFDEFMQVDIRLGTIMAVAVVAGADKLLQLTVDLGEDAPRQIVSGIREYFDDEQVLVGRQCPFIVNLPPRTIRGCTSQGMILAGDSDDTFALFEPSAPLPPGTRLH